MRASTYAIIAVAAAALTLPGCTRDRSNTVSSPRCSSGARSALSVDQKITRDHTNETKCSIVLTNTSSREVVIERARLVHHAVAGAVGFDDSWNGYVRTAIAPEKSHRIPHGCSDGAYIAVAAFGDDLIDPRTGDETACYAEFEQLSFRIRETLCEGESKYRRAPDGPPSAYNCRP